MARSCCCAFRSVKNVKSAGRVIFVVKNVLIHRHWRYSSTGRVGGLPRTLVGEIVTRKKVGWASADVVRAEAITMHEVHRWLIRGPDALLVYSIINRSK